jgi:ferredoxin-NADP reductase
LSTARTAKLEPPMRNNRSLIAATLRRTTDLSPNVREFEIVPDVGVVPWTVGSHLQVQVTIDDDAGTRSDLRNYSLVGLPEADAYRIAVKRTAQSRGGSRFMWRLAAGERLTIMAPNNHFELSLRPPQTLLVAGGIGITPLLGAALTLAAQGADLRMCYAASQASELVYADSLRAALGDRLATFVSAAGQRVDLAAEIATLHPQGQMLVCGPLTMLHAAQAEWAAAGRPERLLRFETFGAGGTKPAQAFWVELPRHGLSLQVSADRSLLEVLNDNGVDTLYDCLRGECGLCAVDILRVQGEVDHRDVYFSAQERRSNQRLCACVSRICGGGVVLDSSYRPDAA